MKETDMRVTKEDVIRAASDLADQQGLNGVSLKSVAEQLGLRAPSLYNHVLSLDDLLRDMAHRGMREMNRRIGGWRFRNRSDSSGVPRLFRIHDRTSGCL